MGLFGNTSAFKDAPKSNDPDKTDVLFNEPGQAGQHGHVTQSQTSDGQTQYHYVRDNDGDVYIDDNPNSGTYTGHDTEPPAPRQ